MFHLARKSETAGDLNSADYCPDEGGEKERLRKKCTFCFVC